MIPDAFRTVDGRTVPAVTAAEMRDVDHVAVETIGVGVLQMMEHAGRGLALEALSLLDGDSVGGSGPRAPRHTAAPIPDEPVVVLAGAGGNGGGGLCAARHLANRGVPVRVVLDRDPGALDGPAATHLSILESMQIDVERGPDATATVAPSVILDALVGYGVDGALRGTSAALAGLANETSAPTLSLDVPSGLDATTGDRPGTVVDADAVLTLALPKTGLDADPAPVLADIGLPAAVYEALDIPYESPFDRRFRVRLVRS
ncbi:sugar kinase [Salinarchaeum sp. Harcht-Bsk1]|uniref:NAD(P)H-hydrate epimerase n=1 Tax=Salinarchaeum sp. Harcht-Bsk1 TaxID=1333523 RepID=UPI000342411C|nr:NAD(P)H-hydrate epimerase [Salinarchaeum sp. Harcht-Bsk1]AGN00697.1 sugar kinase [Salinarchaeum sp. Harcht-Bsk1]